MLTVLLATKNRADILREVLEAYCRLQAPEGGWKLVVIDNGSTDQTGQIVKSFAQRLPVQFLLEPRPGKNFALNTGLALVDGDLVVFTDDDAFPSDDWLVSLRKAADAHPDATMFGGVVLPRWEETPPSWIRWADVSAVFTISDLELADGPTEPHNIFGPNMAVRTSVFRAGTRFDTTIGPRGSSYAMGSETELVLRLSRQGHKAWFVQAAEVEHLIRKEQLETSWVLQRGIRFGRGQFRLYGVEQNKGLTSWRGVPLHLYRRAVKQGVVSIFALLSGRKEARFRARWRLSYFRGQIQEARIMAESGTTESLPNRELASKGASGR